MQLSDFVTVKEVTRAHFETLYTDEEEVDPISIQEMLSLYPIFGHP
jgi:hypothetical protein